ncbi:hypothetical protein V6N13_025422 [Hibiscus sabdariffa]|uniref:Transmembrane protein n=1 Tax=Hibiscus sabdariffa TaxID=183260 RepID=A0ABR2P972_9ROSI
MQSLLDNPSWKTVEDGMPVCSLGRPYIKMPRSVMMVFFGSLCFGFPGFSKGSNAFKCRSGEELSFKLGFYSLMLTVNACLALRPNGNALGICCQDSHFDRFSIQVYGSFVQPLKFQKRCICLSIGCRFIRCDVFSVVCFVLALLELVFWVLVILFLLCMFFLFE